LFIAQALLKIAAYFYGLSLGSTILEDRQRSAVYLFLCPALIANAVAVLLRYRQAWPMLPMYLGPVALPLCLGCLFFLIRQHSGHAIRARRIVLAQSLLICLAAVLFPKDYYLPFIKSQTVWAHLFLLFGVAGKGCFLVCAALASATLIGKKTIKPPAPNTGNGRTLRWAVWGFAFWTLAMFSGELWSYLGWGTPVVWEDPAITTTMATWFFYICLLHLHLTGSWRAGSRDIYAAAGALVIFIFNCIPELGPFRWPL
jgi:hypothetical protein